MKSVAMEPTIASGSVINLDRNAYLSDLPKRWDIVGFKKSGGTEVWIFRILGMPNETISITDDSVKVNGKFLTYPDFGNIIKYLPPYKVVGSPEKSKFKIYRVPTDSYFLVGDNSKVANDSRFSGSVHISNILGKVILMGSSRTPN